MEDLSYDFDVLAERADDCGAMWALRSLRRLASSGGIPAADWGGTIDEARKLVATFAERAGVADRESLATIVLHSAELMWTDCIERMNPASESPPMSPELMAAIEPAISWHLDLH